MGWIIVILCLSEVWLTTTQSADHSINVRDYDCDTQYDLDDYKSMYLNYNGADVLNSNPCSVEFTKSSTEQLFCVSAQTISLDCDTKLEYHEYFVKNYIDPEKRITCNDQSTEEWCPSQYQDNIFIVIRKEAHETSDFINLRVYLKDVPDDGFSSVSSTVWISLIAPAIIIVMTIAVVVCKIKARQAAASQRPQIRYQTTSGAVNMQPGNVGYQPAPQAYFPSQQSTVQQVQGDYHVHPMQTAYPVTDPQSSAQQGVNRQQYPSAPPVTSPAAPPPSYESVVGRKT